MKEKNKLFAYFKPYWGLALLAPLLMIGEVIMDLIQPQLMSQIIDQGVLGLANNHIPDFNIILNTGFKMILYVIIGGFLGVMCAVTANLCALNFCNDLRKDAFKSIMSLSLEQSEQFTCGSLITRVTNDITQIQNLANTLMRGLSRTLVMFIGGIVCMFLLDVKFGLVITAALPLVFVIVIVVIKKVGPLFSILQKKLDRVNNIIQESIAGLRVVKAYVREDYEKERFAAANNDMVDTQLNVLLIFSILSPLMNIILNCVVVAVIKVGGLEVQAGLASPGNIVAAITYVSQILNGILRLVMIFQTMTRGVASIHRVEEVLTCEPIITDGQAQCNLNAGGIEFKHVSFAYPNSREMVLHDLNLYIQPGETLGILGATGSGKSSLVNLIPRFYDVNEGEVLVDGINVKDYPLDKLRGKVAIALQKSELFTTSIKENIAWGNPEASDEEIIQAAAAAQAFEFIENTPDGFETMVTEQGMSLSGGQKQRLAISRAILKNAPILILDDATSALDLKTEANLYQALNKHYNRMTKIIIAQRITSVQGADRIALIENGTLAACDTHEKLLKENQLYQDIYNSQLKGGAFCE